ncbi:MAG: putative rRNA maturation factor [Parcubacteria group bacterium GW2011_GWF2_39_8b]|uniref:Endoribonuclease YbeY n=3 Tax=Candidatus Zambryskiibacteriota TaxID=1817925 RepID=A0A1G2TAL0_9BACT|nr:MAG: putative rRNA maturation factor [Parcubacteria group bacterium GW2011_GWF2_39_8b]KKR45860.1 MAG: putative rRNA maturation factor [Parcubacteria group bacterium GW2011_GWA2_40_14]OHA93651.1 MAG: rRNA maturation RNase YbeY [Candidatus Zambryskibacteria bacterium RIFCSPHIGHO2_02_38_10.5]OHA97766.1 MAG: rRNA maturation RNase YbeY [Candidatus Zambryskibacteria bacterium RIFCSPHIGHO2_12_FULL_38_37]OHB09072.1 MAG: rRNA maturation RNase YbeY [Candidatus Zambryskibacteria bacterium RIFCSPLOWO2_0
MVKEDFTITNKTKSTLSRVPFAKIKNVVLGKNYSLSLVFIGEKKSRELNCKYRGKNKPTNILSFPLNKKSGEIFITPSLAKKEGLSVGFLLIHGLLHLKGIEHGSTMERAEIKLQKKFGV